MPKLIELYLKEKNQREGIDKEAILELIKSITRHCKKEGWSLEYTQIACSCQSLALLKFFEQEKKRVVE